MNVTGSVVAWTLLWRPTVDRLQKETIMIQTIVALAIFAGLGYTAWKQIPPEDPEIIEARKRYGRVGD